MKYDITAKYCWSDGRGNWLHLRSIWGLSDEPAILEDAKLFPLDPRKTWLKSPSPFIDAKVAIVPEDPLLES